MTLRTKEITTRSFKRVVINKQFVTVHKERENNNKVSNNCLIILNSKSASSSFVFFYYSRLNFTKIGLETNVPGISKR